MKVLMIPSGYYPDCCGGVEVITQAISEGLVSQGWNVTVLCTGEQSTEYWYNGVHVVKIVPVTFSRGPHAIRNRINRMLQMYNPFNVSLLVDILKKEKPDIIHLHMARLISMSILTAANKCNIPVVSTLHEYFSLWNFDPFHRMEDVVCTTPQFYVEWIRNIHRRITSRVAHVTSPMEKTFSVYQEEDYYKKCTYSHIENALWPVLEADINTIKQCRMERKARKILMISRLMPFKGIEESVQLFSQEVLSSEWELHIAGDGPMRPYIEEICKTNSKITYHGYVIDEKKEKLFNECDVLLFLTSELETYGLVVLEAFQHGMPVIVSDVTAMRNIVTNKENGLILNDINSGEFCKAFQYIENDENYKALVMNICNMHWKDEYENMIEAYAQIYLGVVK